ncbi:phage minor head protein [Enterocloster sp.]|uniref:phage head morphogenesis protein n=1 Tax=Enterocloster sp. TaxID=2719315 RepID=UPI00399F268F
MDRFLEERGYDGLTPYHADRIFRQNMLTAYSVGHYQQMTDPDVMGRRRYWQYQTAGDRHVRESHAAMDGRYSSGFPGVGYLVSAQRIRLPVYGCLQDGGAGKAYGAYRGAGPAGYVQYGHRRDGGAAAGPEVPDEPGEGGVEAGPGCVPTGLKEAVPGTAEGA